MKKKYIIIIMAIVAIIAIFFLWPKDRGSAYVLVTEKVETGDLTTAITATGTVEPITLVEIGTQVSGVISKIYVDYNSVVKEGQVIAELDRRLLNSELESAQATLQSKQVDYAQQQRTYNRNKELWQKQAISKADWEAVETAYETAQLAVTSAKASVFKAQTNLGYATIYSTIDGVVVSRAVEEGQTVAASFSTPTLFTIANDLTKMRVIANVDEADIGDVKEGQRVMFTVDAYPDDQFEGEVVQVRLEATTTSNVVTYEVVVNAPNPDLKLKPGLTANVNIYTLEDKGVLTIPSKALRFTPNEEIVKQIKDLKVDSITGNDKPKSMVWIKDGNAIKPQIVTVGSSDGINTEIKSGLSQGQEVVTGITEQKKGVSEGSQSDGSSPFMPKGPSNKKK